MCVYSPKRSLDSSDNILAFLELYAYHWLDFAVFIHIFKPLTFRIILKFESAYDLHMYMYMIYCVLLGIRYVVSQYS